MGLVTSVSPTWNQSYLDRLALSRAPGGRRGFYRGGLAIMCQVAYLWLGCCKGIYFRSYYHIAHIAACEPGVRSMTFWLTINNILVKCPMLINLNTCICHLHTGLCIKIYTANVMRQQTITWANVGPDLCHHVASLGHNEFPIISCIVMLFMSSPNLPGMR